MEEEFQSKLHDYKETGIKPFDWSKYNQSQTKEKTLFIKLLDELCQVVDMESSFTSHRIFCMCMKVYLNTSARRVISDLDICKKMGYLYHLPHFNTVLSFFNDQNLKKTLKHLIELSAIPLAQLERKFSIDSSGISLHQYKPWIHIRDKYKEHRNYKKIHIICGTLSNIAVSCCVTRGTAADSPQFESLLKRAADNFSIEHICADLAYSSKDNLQLASDLGCVPFIPFKSNAKGSGLGIWSKMFYYFKNHQEEFMKNYHLRSNSESTFMQIKTRFGEFIKSKNDVSQENEILVKVLCHNLCILIQEIFLQGIEVNFLSASKKFVAQ